MKAIILVILCFLPRYHNLWSEESKKLYVACMKSTKETNIHLPDEVQGAAEPTLDTCLSKCRAKGATWMALKVDTCFCTSMIPADIMHGTNHESCMQSQCPVDFKCGKFSTMAFYITCPKWRWGPTCKDMCHCRGGKTCRAQDGFCMVDGGACEPGYVGRACNLTDPCVANECKNKGVCNITEIAKRSVTWECDCAPGFFGKDCSQECPLNKYGDDCVFSCYCADNKHCFVKNGSCPNGCNGTYHGKDCSMINMCLSAPCKNGGTCIPDEDVYFCDCPHAYAGADCGLLRPKVEAEVNGSFAEKRLEVLEQEQKALSDRIAKEALENALPSDVLGVTFEEDFSIFFQVAKTAIDLFLIYVYKQEPPQEVVENINPNLGCFLEPRGHDLKNLKNIEMKGSVEVMTRPMSIGACRDLCRKNNFNYAAALDGEVCLCDDTYGKNGHMAPSYCNIKCADDERMSCGGQGIYSLYTVCRIGHYGPNCEFGCFCADFPCDVVTGACPDGVCRNGWSGPTCSHRLSKEGSLDLLTIYLLLAVSLTLLAVCVSFCIPCLVDFEKEQTPDQKWFIQNG